MNEDRKPEIKKQIFSSSVIDIDQLCHLIDENTFGLKTFSSSKLSSISSYQIKIFNSTRLKRLNSSSSSSIIKSNFNENYSSLLNRFGSLSTYNLSQSRHYPTKLMNNDDEMNNSIQSQSSCSNIDSQSTSTNSCNVEELTAYFDHFLYLPKSLSGAAELMYT